ncbi:hypothetical protein BS78_09G068900 [Paspalum vaginatum]|nr:hypothetical protein BS78_09G068900 [Paspalum vaginatum]
MEMAELQRSQTFRRSGSSGLVWGKNQRDHGVTGDAGEDSQDFKELRHSRSDGSIGMLQQPRGNDGKEHGRSNGANQAFGTRHVLPALDPPSPKIARCMFCGIFRKEGPSQSSKSNAL